MFVRQLRGQSCLNDSPWESFKFSEAAGCVKQGRVWSLYSQIPLSFLSDESFCIVFLV